MNFLRTGVDCFIPDAAPILPALSRCTHLCIAAHQDDIEILAYPGIAHCYDHSKGWFVGVVVTDGSGSIRHARHQKLSPSEYTALRRTEQRKAATLGRYSTMIQLGLSSPEVRHSQTLIHDLTEILFLTQPHTIYLHSPADRHETHVAVFLRCLEAIRKLPADKIPQQIYGCEVWGSLDWLPATHRVALDSGFQPDLAAQLLTVFTTQIEGGKRYDLATLGRRQANATFANPYTPDPSLGITWAMDLSQLVKDNALSVEEFLKEIVKEFSRELQMRLHRVMPLLTK